MSGGRARTLKPEILEDEKTAGLTHEAYRLFVGLILVADDYGNLRANPKLLDASVFWARETLASVSEHLRELEATGLIRRYEVRGQPYVHVCGWSKHQKIDRPSKPKAPGPHEADGARNPAESSTVASDSRDPRECVSSPSRDTRPGEERKGEERRGGDARKAREPALDPELGSTFGSALLALGLRVAVGAFAWKDLAAACRAYWPDVSGPPLHERLRAAVTAWAQSVDAEDSRGWDHREFIRWANKGHATPAKPAVAKLAPVETLGPLVPVDEAEIANLLDGLVNVPTGRRAGTPAKGTQKFHGDPKARKRDPLETATEEAKHANG